LGQARASPDNNSEWISLLTYSVEIKRPIMKAHSDGSGRQEPPGKLSLLGLVGGLLLLTSAVVEMFAYGADAPVALQLLGAAPIALQEMILAVLQIWKGFAAPSVTAANGEPGRGSG